MIDKVFFQKAEQLIKGYKENQCNGSIKDYLLKSFKNEPHHIQNRILNEFFAYGPLHNLINDNEITEIIITNYNNIFYEKKGQFKKYEDIFYSLNTYQNFIHLVNKETNSKIDLVQPHLNLNWNGFRVHMITKPISKYTSLTLRKNSLFKFNFDTLIEHEWASTSNVGIIKKLILENKNILVIGTTGSGKTTVLNCILQTINNYERCVIIEDTDELICPNELSVKLLTRKTLNDNFLTYDQCELVKQSLRMRPQRLIIGEIRGEEAKDYLLSLSTGHAGGICSLHANSAKQALIRLEMLIQLGAPQWSIYSIRKLIQFSLDYIITVDFNDNLRHLKSIDKVHALEENGLTLENIFASKKNNLKIANF